MYVYILDVTYNTITEICGFPPKRIGGEKKIVFPLGGS